MRLNHFSYITGQQKIVDAGNFYAFFVAWLLWHFVMLQGLTILFFAVVLLTCIQVIFTRFDYEILTLLVGRCRLL